MTTGKNRKKVLIVGRMPQAGIDVLKTRDDVDYEILTDDTVPSLHPKLKDANAVTLGATNDSEAVVEWRALTLALIDRLADRVRDKLQLTSEQLPLAKVLQGGTWSAGRLLARQLRRDGGPPLRVISDGTLF